MSSGLFWLPNDSLCPPESVWANFLTILRFEPRLMRGKMTRVMNIRNLRHAYIISGLIGYLSQHVLSPFPINFYKMNLVFNRKDESSKSSALPRKVEGFLLDHQFNQDFIPNCIFKEWKLFFQCCWSMLFGLTNFHGTIFFSKLSLDFPSNSFLLHEAHKSSVMLSNANDCLNWWNIYAGNDGQKLAKLQLDNIGLAQLAASEMTLQEFCFP